MSPVPNERTKLTAASLNTIASASVVVGVIGPVAAAGYGLGASPIAPLALAVGVVAWFGIGTAIHWLARYVLRGLKP